MVDTFTRFLNIKKFRTNALSCFHSMVHKGMDYPQKVELIANLKLMDLLESFPIKYPERVDESDNLEEQENEEVFFAEMSEIVDGVG